MVLDNDADAGALRARAELDLGALGQGSLGEGEGPIKAGNVALAQLVGLSVIDTRCDGLPQPLETGYLLGLWMRC
jgi:hypothetical protein